MGKKKELGLDSMGVQKTMRTSDYIGDGVGMLALNGLAGIVGQMTYFYTDKVGMAAGAVATVLLLSKVLDGFTDLIMGKIMDSAKFKSGEKCRPWFKIMLFPAALIAILMFTVPHAGPDVQLGYAFLTNILLSAVVYTAIAIPYTSLQSIRTRSLEERGKMGIVRAIFSYLIGMILAMLTIPLTNMLGGDQTAWIKYGVIIAVVIGGALIVLYAKTKETVVGEAGINEEKVVPEENVPFLESIRLLVKNKYWVITLLANAFMGIFASLSASSSVYYAKWVLGNDNLVALLGAVGLIPTILGFIAVNPMVKKFGMAKASYISAFIGIVACAVRVFTPYSIVSCIGCGIFTSFASMIPMCLIGPMINNCVEYNEWMYGKRMVGMTNSASSFGGKIAGGIGGALIGWLLALGNYDPSLAVQPKSAIIAIFAFSIYIPLALFTVQFILFRKYDLEGKYAQILSDLKERRGKQ